MPEPATGTHRTRGRAGAGLRRLAGALVVIALHAGVIYALVTGLAQRTVEIVRAPIETRILPPDQPVPPPAPPPPPRLAPPPLFVPAPEVRIAPPPARSNAVTVVTPAKPPEPAPPVAAPPPVAAAPPPHVPVRVQPRLDPARSHEPAYPPASRRLGEQGSLIVQVLVDPSGNPRDVKLIESSGHARLDDAALAGIRANYRFVPGTLDGKPVEQWFTFRFVWKIK